MMESQSKIQKEQAAIQMDQQRLMLERQKIGLEASKSATQAKQTEFKNIIDALKNTNKPAPQGQNKPSGGKNNT
jgi:hypothetical protein